MKAANPRLKPTNRSIDRNLLKVPLETALIKLVVQARSLMAEPGHIESVKSRFKALCLSVLSIHHGLQVEQTLSLAEHLWSDALRQGSVSKKESKAHKQIPDAEQSDYKTGYNWVFDDSLELHHDHKVSIESTSTLLPFENKVTFGTSAHDDMLTAERKTAIDGRHYILVRRASIDEEAVTLGHTLPNHGARQTRYPTDDAPNGVTSKRLKRLSRARQIETMKTWFTICYKESSAWLEEEQENLFEEPCAAIDLLWAEFSEVVQEHIIRDLADELDEQSRRWIPVHSSKRGAEAGERSQEETKSHLLKQIQTLRDELKRIEPLYGKLGHNNPPEEAQLFPIDWRDRSQVLKALDNLEDQAKTDKPNEVQVEASTLALRLAAAKVWNIAKRKVDKATDKMAEAVGIAVLLEAKDAPAIYHWIVNAVSSLYGKLEAVIQTADLWLKSLHLPF